jgi:hypothetical protein
MQRLAALVVAFGLFSLPVMAQDYSKVELFGGYQYTHLDTTVITPVATANGWDTSATFNINGTIGIAGDFTGAYQHVSLSSLGIANSLPSGVPSTYPGHYYTYAGGPVFNLNSQGKVKPFFHVLVGGVRVSSGVSVSGVSVGASKSGLASIFGGGVDLQLRKHIALRLVQADWDFYHFSPTSVTVPSSGTTFESLGGNSFKNFKIATGIVFTM